MSAAAVVIIIGPRPNRVVGNMEYPGSTDNCFVGIDGLLSDATNGEVASALQDALDTVSGLDQNAAWSGS